MPPTPGSARAGSGFLISRGRRRGSRARWLPRPALESSAPRPLRPAMHSYLVERGANAKCWNELSRSDIPELTSGRLRARRSSQQFWGRAAAGWGPRRDWPAASKLAVFHESRSRPIPCRISGPPPHRGSSILTLALGISSLSQLQQLTFRRGDTTGMVRGCFILMPPRVCCTSCSSVVS